MNPAFDTYIQSLAGRDVTVIGAGVSNSPLIRMLCSAGAHVTVRDRNPALPREDLDNLGVGLRLGENYLDRVGGDVVFRTPGMRPDHPALDSARAGGSRVTSEMEEFFALCPCPIFGVTGSDGKTTTTSLIADMLADGGRTVHLGGNIGHATSDARGRDVAAGCVRGRAVQLPADGHDALSPCGGDYQPLAQSPRLAPRHG